MKLRTLFTAIGALAVSGAALPAQKEVVKEPKDMPAKASPLDFTVKTIDGKEQPLSAFRGKVVMFVNVASRCGYTKQYEPLEATYKKYKDQGLVIVGFPANNFGGQEPGSDAEIQQFCKSKYDVSFPMMSKVSVKGDDKAPVYKFLTEEPTAGEFAGEVGWNFTKFLVDRNGNLIARFATQTSPTDEKVVSAVEKALAAKASETSKG